MERADSNYFSDTVDATLWVESVNGDGTLTVAQYNYYNAGGSGWGHFSRMIVPSGTYQWFVYF